MEIRSYTKLFFGILFFLLGLIGIFNLWDFFSLNLPWQVWPVGIIIVGVLFMVRQKGLAFVVVGLLIILGIFSSGWECCGDFEKVEFSHDFDLVGVDYVDLNLDYGIGDLSVSRGNNESKILFSGMTDEFSEPDIFESIDGNVKEIRISKEGEGFGFNQDDKWSLELGEDAFYNLEFHYGVADVEMDLRGLNVDELKVTQGVSDSKIIFAEYPSVVRLDGGVSDIDLVFPEKYGVVIAVGGGLLDKSFDGFERRGGKWYSEGYDEMGENIDVRFDGGVSDLKASFYS
jgi:hypothetical protein